MLTNATTASRRLRAYRAEFDEKAQGVLRIGLDMTGPAMRSDAFRYLGLAWRQMQPEQSPAPAR